MRAKNYRIFLIATALVISALPFFGCEKIESIVPDVETPQPSQAEIPIGLVVSLTGRYADTYGFPMQRGFALALEEINNDQVIDADLTFITVDDQSTVGGAKAAVQSLVDQGVPVIVGIAISTQLKEAFPIAQTHGVLAFSPVSAAAGLSGIGDFIFRAALATDVLIPVSVAVTQRELGYQTAVTLYDADDVFSTSSNAEIRNALTAVGVDILGVDTFRTGDTDFSRQVATLVAMDPEALFISGFDHETAAIVRHVRERGRSDVHIIAPNLSRHELQQAGGAAEGLVTFASWSRLADTPGNAAFIAAYQAKYGIAPEVWAAQSYATLHLLAAAMATAAALESAAIRDALAQTIDVPTILGDFSFDADGEAIYAPVVLTVKGGELQAFEHVTVMQVLREILGYRLSALRR